MKPGEAEAVHSLRQSHFKICTFMESSLNDCLALTQGAALQLFLEVIFKPLSDLFFLYIKFIKNVGMEYLLGQVPQALHIGYEANAEYPG